jgi:sulfate transport system permease protein
VADVALVAPRPRLGLRLAPASWLGPGVPMLYLSLIVGLPVAALVARSATTSFWSTITAPETRAALELTIGLALLTAVINAVTGIALAWVLVRDDFPGKRIVNAVVDLPFALPTIVAGLVLLSLYGANSPVHFDVAQTRTAILFAMLFVTLPFVTRAVQPVLLTLDRDVEDAAACLGAGPLTTFRRITLPAILPATLTGASLAFARALGEFGSITLLSGNLPFKTLVASVLISGDVENGQDHAAAAVSVALLALALIVFLILSIVTGRNRHG